MKGVATERKPVVGVAEVADPVQVRLPLRVVPPDIAGLLVTIEGMYKVPPVPPPLEYS